MRENEETNLLERGDGLGVRELVLERVEGVGVSEGE